MAGNSFLAGLFAMILVTTVNGAHFLGGSVAWRLQNASATGSPVNIVITQTYSYTYLSQPCTATMIANNQLLPSASGTLICASNCTTGSGGYTNLSATPYCTFGSPVTGITIGQRTDTVSLQSSSDFSVAFTGNSWRSLASGASGSWSVASYINLKPRPDNGRYNNAPVSTMTSPIYIYVNQTTVITVPIGDADGDVVRCRWAKSSGIVDECASVCPPGSLPSNTTIYSNCTIVMIGQNVNSWYAITLMAEDFINSSSTSPLSSVSVQFLVEFIAQPSCTFLPEIIGLPVEQSCTPIKVNQTFTSQLITLNRCGTSVNISDINILSFSGMASSAIIIMNSTTFYKSLTWTPTSTQLGYQVMCATALNSQNSQSAQYCFTFFVTANDICSCPGTECKTTTTTTSTSSIISITSITPMTSINSMNSITTNDKSNSINNWPWIGSIIGVTALASIIFLSCLIWRYYRQFRDRRRKSYKYDEPTEDSKSDACTGQSTLCSKVSPVLKRSPIVPSVILENRVDYNVTDEGTTGAKDPPTPSLSQTNKNLSLIDSHNENAASPVVKRIRPKILTDKSVSKVKIIEATKSSSNPDEKSSKEATTTDLSNDTHVKVSQITSRKKRRSNSFHGNSSLQYNEKSPEQIRARRGSTGRADFVRIIHVPIHSATTQLPPIHDVRPSILENTIRLDDVQETKQSSTAGKTSKDHVRVQHVVPKRWQMVNESRISQIETIKLTRKPSPAEPVDVSQSPNTVRVDRIMVTKKKFQSIIGVDPLKPISEETKRNRQRKKSIESDVIVKFVPRENNVKQ